MKNPLKMQCKWQRAEYGDFIHTKAIIVLQIRRRNAQRLCTRMVYVRRYVQRLLDYVVLLSKREHENTFVIIAAKENMFQWTEKS